MRVTEESLFSARVRFDDREDQARFQETLKSERPVLHGKLIERWEQTPLDMMQGSVTVHFRTDTEAETLALNFVDGTTKEIMIRKRYR